MKQYIFVIMAVYLLSGIPLFSKDIDLDKIYIDNKSNHYKNLINRKIDIYELTGSLFIDKDITFSSWFNGNKILYIKEHSSLNSVYLFDTKIHKKSIIASFKGTVTAAKLSATSKFLYVKRMLINNYSSRGDTLIIDLRTGKMLKKTTVSQFLDFSISPSYNAIIFESKKGIIEFSPEYHMKKLLLPTYKYKDIVNNNGRTIAILSENRKNILCLNGNGGYYNTKLFYNNSTKYIKGITSSSEIYWLSNSSLVYRKGSPGFFSVIILDLDKMKETVLMNNSYNTNIKFSKKPDIISFCKDQMIITYENDNNHLVMTGMEGEDVTFSPDGRWFVSHFNRKLFMTNYEYCKKQFMSIKNATYKIKHIYTKLFRNKSVWNSVHTKAYLIRKIRLYKKFINKN